MTHPLPVLSLALFLGVLTLRCVADSPETIVDAPPSPALTDRSKLSLARIYHSSDFSLKSKPMRWDASEDVLWWKRDNDEGNAEIVRLSIPDGQETVAVSADQFQLPSGERIQVDEYRWSPNHQYLLVLSNSVRVWRTNTRGDYWLLDLVSKSWRKLGGEDASDQSLMFASFSPRGDRIGYVRDRNLYSESCASGEIQTIATSENESIINGTFDWVYEEELSLKRGYRFSPDGSKLAFWQLDESEVPKHSLIDNTSQRYPMIKQFGYPKVGQTNSSAKIGVYDFETTQTVWLNIAGDPRNHYLAAMQWLPAEAPGANARLLVQQLNRRQNENRLWMCDASTGSAVVLLKETSPGWVLHQAHLKPLPALEQGANDSVDFAWLSERSGWQHLYRLSIASTLLSDRIDAKNDRVDAKEVVDETDLHPNITLKPITAGDWDVIEFDAVEAKSGRLYFIASPSNAAARGLYTCDSNLAQTIEKPTRVSPELNGTFSYQVSDSAEFALESWSTFNAPPIKRLVRLSPYERIETFVENATTKAAVDELQPIDEQFISLVIDENTSLDAWIMLPQGSEGKIADHSIPLIVHVYGEPAGQTVRDAFGGRSYLWHRYLTQLGFAVASIDNRGTKSPRGRAFRQSVYEKMGVLPPADQAAGTRRLLERFPELDPTRVGVWGWSGGGSSTLNAMFRYPDLYAAGVSVAPVADQLDYDTIYQERYMGLVEDNRQLFVDGSPLTHVEGLADPLLIIHGTGDDNVHYGSTERLINRLVAAGKQFRLIAYPGRSHSISEGEGTTMHLRQMMTDFFVETLQPQPLQ